MTKVKNLKKDKVLVISEMFTIAMASVMSILTCTSMFFIVNFHILASAENIDKGGKLDWELALQKIDELQKTVHAQDERISMLEKRPSESEIQTLTELQSTVKKQGTRIAQLEVRIKELETVVKADENIPVEILRNGQLSETNGTSVMSKTTHSRRGTFKFRFVSYIKLVVINNLLYFFFLSNCFKYGKRFMSANSILLGP